MDYEDPSKAQRLKDESMKFLNKPDFPKDNGTCNSGSTYSVMLSEKTTNHRPSSAQYNYINRDEPKKKKMMPKCKITRGLFLAIFFSIFVCLIIIWFFFSADLNDEEFESYGHNQTNSTYPNMLLYNSSIQQSSKTFVVLWTVLIVLIIILFVFMGSLIQYLRNPGLYTEDTIYKVTPRKALLSIFATPVRNIRNDLYYLDKNMKNEEEREEAMNNNELGWTCSKKNSRTFTFNKKNSRSNSKTPTTPLIVVTE